MESSYRGAAAEPQTSNQDLVRIADELLEQTRTLRRQHEELREALAGIRVAPRVERERPAVDEDDEHEDGKMSHKGLHAMVLQMALAGQTREETKEQLAALGVEGGDEVADEVFDRADAHQPEPRRKRFARRG